MTLGGVKVSSKGGGFVSYCTDLAAKPDVQHCDIALELHRRQQACWYSWVIFQTLVFNPHTGAHYDETTTRFYFN